MNWVHRTDRDRYIESAQKLLSIDMDGKQIFARVPSEHDAKKSYRVDIIEHTPTDLRAVNCSCPDHKYRQERCKHMIAVDLFYINLFRRSGAFNLYSKTPSAIATYDIQQAADAVVRDAELDHAYEVRGPEIQCYIEEHKSVVPTPARPHRYNREQMCYEVLCCGRWWSNGFCLYGNHDLREEGSH